MFIHQAVKNSKHLGFTAKLKNDYDIKGVAWRIAWDLSQAAVSSDGQPDMVGIKEVIWTPQKLGKIRIRKKYCKDCIATI